MSTSLKYGGLAASIVLIAFGIGAIYTGVDGVDRVHSDLAREKIVGTPDSSIAGKLVDTGAEAQTFAETIRKHTLAETGGKTYAEMSRDDPARQVWVTSTALQTALNTAYFAEGVAKFAIVMGIAMLLSGIGFLILTLRVLRGPGANEASPERTFARREAVTAG